MGNTKKSIIGAVMAFNIGSMAHSESCHIESIEAYEFSTYIHQLISKAGEDTNKYGYAKPEMSDLLIGTVNSLAQYANDKIDINELNALESITTEEFMDLICNILINLENPDTELSRDFMLSVINPALSEFIDPHTQYLMVLDREEQEASSLPKKSTVPADYVTSEILNDGTGYIRLEEFELGVANEIKIRLASMILSETPPQKFILDLRDNPGGLVIESARIADLFLNGYKVIYDGSLTNDSRINEYPITSEFYHAGDILGGLRLSVLINERSASASEYLAGTLQHYQRANVYGVNSNGKATSQVIENLHYYALALTTNTPPLIAGETTHQGYGITPNVRVTSYDIPDDTFYERDYPNMIDLSHIPLQYPDRIETCGIVAPDPILACALNHRPTP